MATNTSRLTNTGTLLVNGSFDEVFLTPGSVLFNGTSQNLTVNNSNGNQAFNFAANNVTIECWVNHNVLSGSENYYRTQGSGVNAAYGLRTNGPWIEWFGYDAVGTKQFGLDLVNIAGAALTTSTWYHIAAVRNGNVHTVYVNGVAYLTSTTSYTAVVPQSSVWIGAFDQTEFMNGYISNLRVVNGSAVYTSNFTPPAAPLPNITNTTLLLNMPNNAAAFADASNNNFSITPVSSPTSSSLDPFTLNTVERILSNQLQVTGGLDEVTLPSNGTTKQRLLSDGTLQVSGYFDEKTIWDVIFVGSVTQSSSSGASTYTNISTIQAGDLIVVALNSANINTSTPPSLTLPAGYTSIVSKGAYNSPSADAQTETWAYKIATAADAGASVTYSSDTGAVYRSAVSMVFRPNAPATTITSGSINSFGTTGSQTTPPTQTVTASSGATPLIVFASYLIGGGGTVPTRTFSPTADQEIPSYYKYKIYNSSPLDTTVSDTISGGTCNSLQSFYLSIS